MREVSLHHTTARYFGFSDIYRDNVFYSFFLESLYKEPSQKPGATGHNYPHLFLSASFSTQLTLMFSITGPIRNY